jgi:hypothetical protein
LTVSLFLLHPSTLPSKTDVLVAPTKFEKEFLNSDHTSIFGNSPSLNIDDEDNGFAYHLIKLVVNWLMSDLIDS